MNPADKIKKQVAQDLDISVDIVEAVVAHQSKSVNEQTHLCSSVEITGFGTFSAREMKFPERLKKLTEMKDAYSIHLENTTDEYEKISLSKKIQTCIDEITYITSKINDQ